MQVGVLLDEVLILFVFCLLARVIEYRLKKRGSQFALPVFSWRGSLLNTNVQKKENVVVDRLFAVFDADQETTELLSPMKPVFD